MKTFDVRLVGLLACLSANACLHSPPLVVPPGAELVAIQVSPSTPALARGTSLQLLATGLYEGGDDGILDLTTHVTWHASAPAVATVSASGVVSGLAEGEGEITATLGSVTGTTRVRVTAASLARLDVTPSTLTLARGTVGTLQVMGTFSDLTTQELTDQVTWSTTGAAVATVSNEPGSRGAVTAVAPGTTKVIARFGVHSSECQVTVTAARLASLGLTPATASLARGLTRQFFATGVFTDATTQDLTEAATWSSADRTVASIATTPGQQGLVTAVGIGTTSVSATVEGVTGMATVQVTAAGLLSLVATPASLSLPLGVTAALSVTGTFTDTSTQPMTQDVVWTSADPTIAEVSNAAGSEGLVTPLSPGTTSVTARAGLVSVSIAVVVTPAELVSLAVTPPALSTPRGLTRQLVATGTYTDGSTQVLTAQVAWSSSNPALAAISSAPGSEGEVEALEIGTVTLTAATGTRSGSTTFEVTPAALERLTIAPGILAVAKGREQQFSATGTYTDGTELDLTATATWTSSNPGVTAVSNAPGTEGLATALALGVARVTATLGSISGSSEVTVNAAELIAVFLSPATAQVALGRTLQLTAFGRYSDSDVRDVSPLATWASDAPTIARVSNLTTPVGLVSPLSEGAARVSATVGNLGGEVIVTVTAAELVALAIDPATASVREGGTVQLSARGTFSDNSIQDLTTSVTWSAQHPGVASVTGGLVEGVSPGSTTITASSGGSSATATLTVTAQRLLSIVVTQTSDPSTLAGQPASFSALGTYDNGRTRDLTALATWASSDLAIATPRTITGQEGTFDTFAQGTINATATFGGVEGQATLFVGPAGIVSFSVTPTTASIAAGGTTAFTAIGLYSDGSSRTITDECDWVSLAPEVATVTNSQFPLGVATGVTAGTTTIQAQCTADFATATLTVTP